MKPAETLRGRPTSTGGPVHIREVIAELLARHEIVPARQQDRSAPPALWSDERSIVAVPAGAGCR